MHTNSQDLNTIFFDGREYVKVIEFNMFSKFAINRSREYNDYCDFDLLSEHICNLNLLVNEMCHEAKEKLNLLKKDEIDKRILIHKNNINYDLGFTHDDNGDTYVDIMDVIRLIKHLKYHFKLFVEKNKEKYGESNIDGIYKSNFECFDILLKLYSAITGNKTEWN